MVVLSKSMILLLKIVGMSEVVQEALGLPPTIIYLFHPILNQLPRVL